MHKKLHSSIRFSLLFITFGIFAQSYEISRDLGKNYAEYYSLSREAVFLHLNKTSFIINEDLWFAAYVQNLKLNLPNSETANLKVEIFKDDGIHLETLTVHISNGKGSGYLSLDPEIFPPGNYFLKASTSYMDNFEEDLTFSQPFTVLGDRVVSEPESRLYDLQLLPEGGHLLAGSINSVGVKLIDDSGAGTAFHDARLLDSRNKEVTSFHSNRFGLSKFFFIPVANEKYKVVLTTDTGEKLEHLLPPSKEEGINLINTIRNGEHHLAVKTNQRTRKLLKDENFIVAVHKNGNYKDLEFSFPDDQLEVNIIMKMDSLFPGVNTVTIFDQDLQPVLERMIFNNQSLNRSRVSASIKSLQNDSLGIELQIAPENFRSSLSISALPAETRAYNPQHNIISAIHLKPYIKGHIDEVSYYLNHKKTPRQEYDLDLLLLSQGWSKYDWSSSFLKVPEELVPHEIGFTIRGKMNNSKKKHEQILIASEDTGLFEIVSLQPNGTFELERAFIRDSTKLSYGLINNKNDKITMPSVSASVYPIKDFKDLEHSVSFGRRKEFHEVARMPKVFPYQDNVLDTVMLTEKKRKDAVFTPDLQTHARGIEITEDIANRYFYITDYIATKGYQVRYMQGEIEIRSLTLSTLRPGTNSKHKKGRSASSNVLLYLNGAPMGTNASFLNGLLSDQVESIVINKLGHGEGMSGVNGVIKINLKKGAYVQDREETIRQVIVNNGYALRKEFYSPRYKDYNSTPFRQFGVIDWKPSKVFDVKGRAEIQIPNRGATKLFIEGMGADGSLIWEELEINKH